MLKYAKKWVMAVVAACVIGLATNVRANNIIVELITDWEVGPLLLNENSESLATNSLAMLFWTANQNFEGFNNINPAVPTGSDILLDALSITGSFLIDGHITNETTFSYSSADYPADDLASGYVYVAAFNLAYTTYQSIGVPEGTRYSLMPLVPFKVSDKPEVTSFADDVGAAITAGGSYTMVHQTIPEPGTMVLFAIGSVAFLGLRHRFKRS